MRVLAMIVFEVEGGGGGRREEEEEQSQSIIATFFPLLTPTPSS